MIGTCVGNYHVVRELGSGAMGTVYEAVDTLVHRPVALKVLRPGLAKEPDLVERFRTEAMTLARLNHPNIALLYSFFQHDGEYFMAMEYVHGRPLESLLSNSQLVTPGSAASIMSQVLEGMAHAHRMGVLHRDIKPANILVAEDGRVKVTDFGIARMLGSSRATRHGRIIGTLEYIAPERIRGNESDPRSDLYSAGIVLYEMLAGRLPFTHQTDYELLKAHLEQDPPALPDLGGHSPSPWNPVIQRALAKSPEQRFQSAEEFQRQILVVANRETYGSEPSTTHFFPAPMPGSTWKANLISLAGQAPKSLLMIAAVVIMILSAAVIMRLQTLNAEKQLGRRSAIPSKAVSEPTPAPVAQPPSLLPQGREVTTENPQPKSESPAFKPAKPGAQKATHVNSEQEEAREATLCALNQDSTPRCRDLIRKQTLRALK